MGARRALPPLHRGKDHRERIRRSELFRHCAQTAVHGREQGDAARLVALALSANGLAAEFIADECTGGRPRHHRPAGGGGAPARAAADLVVDLPGAPCR